MNITTLSYNMPCKQGLKSLMFSILLDYNLVLLELFVSLAHTIVAITAKQFQCVFTGEHESNIGTMSHMGSWINLVSSWLFIEAVLQDIVHTFENCLLQQKEIVSLRVDLSFTNLR